MKKLYLVAMLLSVMCMSKAQNVGIGVINPTRAKLEVNGAAGRTSAIFGGESTGISLQRDWPSVGFNQYYTATEGRYMGNGFALVQYLNPAVGVFNIDIFPSGTANGVTPAPKRVMSVLPSGSVVFGGTTLDAAFTISRNPVIPVTLAIGGTSHNTLFHTGALEDIRINPGKSFGNVFLSNIPGGTVTMCSGDGRVGVNTASPNYTVDIYQSFGGIRLVEPAADFQYWEIRTASHIPAELSFLYDDNVKGFIDPTSGNYISVSDRRLKTNIQPLSPLLNKIMQLQPVEYEMKENNPLQSSTIGFIAQDVKQIFPQLVKVIPDTSGKKEGLADLHTINYAGFAPVAIKAIQEQQQVITALRTEVDELKRTVDGLLNSYIVRTIDTIKR